jgi:DNA replication and repair protein RecF
MPGAGPLVFTGPNGAGKTNLLEAVSYLSPGRGLRGARLADVLNTGGPAGAERTWSVAATVHTARGAVELASGYRAADSPALLDTRDSNAAPLEARGSNAAPLEARGSKGVPARERRIVRIDGETAAGQAALAEHVAIVWLTPAMDRLLVDGAAGRRRFLDRLVFALDPAHAGRTLAFEHSRRERARLLAEGRDDDRWLGAIERSMAERAVAMAAARHDLVARLGAAVEESEGVFPRPALALQGLVEAWLDAMPALAAEERYREHLAAERGRDAETETCDGPHRSDLIVRFAATGREAEQCSTGEQKALLIALVLAHARLIARLRQAPPILLLDEVVAHLDAARRAAFFQELLALDGQAWLTGTEPAPFEPLRGVASFYAVRRASVTEEADRG